MIPLQRAWKGLHSSASPAGEKTVQGCLAIRGASLPVWSFAMRWAQARERMFAVVVVVDVVGGVGRGWLGLEEGDAASSSFSALGFSSL